MKTMLIAVGGVLLLLAAWVTWVMAKPSTYRQMQRQRIEAPYRRPPLPTTTGNSITTYTSLGDMMDTLMADIASADSRVHMQFFKFEDDATGRRVADAMAERAGDGVQCRLLYDEFMCHGWKRFYRDMRRQGIETACYNRVHWPVPWRNDYYRNHRKIIVVDDRVAYLGGVNIADRYLHGLPWGCWRDTMVRIEGPAVADAERVFNDDWQRSVNADFRTRDWVSTSASATDEVTPAASGLKVGILASGPLSCGPTIMDYTARLLDGAKSYVWLESPYFIPTLEIKQAMYGAARRGVDVRLLLPPRGDQSEATQLASKSHFAEAMQAGVKIGLYRPGYMHSKIVVSDDKVAMVGSCNLDPRSHLLCEEVAAVVENENYAREIGGVFLRDEAQADYIDPAAWTERPAKEKIKEAVTHVVAPLL